MLSKPHKKRPTRKEQGEFLAFSLSQDLTAFTTSTTLANASGSATAGHDRMLITSGTETSGISHALAYTAKQQYKH